MPSPKLPAHLSVLTANLIYGANYSIAKKVMPSLILPFGFIFIRVLVTAIIFLVLDLFIKSRKVEKEDYPRLFFCALFGVALNQLLFFKGLDNTTPINAALMMTTNPIMVLIVASLLIREKITAKKIAGIIIGVIGAATLILFGKSFSMSHENIAGNIMVLINSLSFGVFLIIVKPLMQKYSTLTVMKWVFLFGSILVIPFGYSEFDAIRWDAFDNEAWWALTYVVIATTSLAYMLNTYALKNLTPSSVSVYIYLQPLFATLFAIMLGKDSLNMLHIIAAILIFTGVHLVTSGNFMQRASQLVSRKKD